MSLAPPRGQAADAPTGVRELTEELIVAPAPRLLRVSVVGDRTQLDISLPADARVADIVPRLADLIAGRGNAGQDPGTARGDTTRRHLLTRQDADGDPLPPAMTLRDAGVRPGDLLHLRTERTLRPPTLYDDVVDAAAQLNRAAFAAWGPASAAVMAAVALYACVAILVWMSWDVRFAAERPVIVGVQVAAAVALLSAAFAAHRFSGESRAAAAFGWAAMILTAAALAAALAGWRQWGPIIACVGVIVLNLAYHRLIGAGLWGFLAGAVIAAGAAVLSTVHTVAGVDAKTTGAVVAAAAIALCHLVPRYTGARHRRAPVAAPPDQALRDPFGSRHIDADPAAAIPTVEEVRARARSAAAVRSALFTGLGVTTVLALAYVMTPWSQPRWQDLAFAAGCAVAVGMRARTGSAAVEQAGLASAAALAVLLACAAAAAGPPPFPVTALTALGVMVLGAAAAGMAELSPRPARRWAAALDYAEYVALGSVVPLGLWVAGMYAHLGGTG